MTTKLAACLIGIACGLAPACTPGSDDGPRDLAGLECRERPDDPTGYLQPICEHITASFDTYEIDPNELTIERVTPGDQEPGATEPFDAAEFDWVHLSCCFTGDTAVLRRADRTVVLFVLGDV